MERKLISLSDNEMLGYFTTISIFSIVLSLGGANLVALFTMGLIPILADILINLERGVKG
jgi:hypothetical protein